LKKLSKECWRSVRPFLVRRAFTDFLTIPRKNVIKIDQVLRKLGKKCKLKCSIVRILEPLLFYP